MKIKLLLYVAAFILFTSCKKETPAVVEAPSIPQLKEIVASVVEAEELPDEMVDKIVEMEMEKPATKKTVATSLPLDSMPAFVDMMADMKAVKVEKKKKKEKVKQTQLAEKVTPKEVKTHSSSVASTITETKEAVKEVIAKKEVKEEVAVKTASVKKPVAEMELTDAQHRNIYAKLLKKYVSSDGKVDYKGLLSEKDKLVFYTSDPEKYLPLPSASDAKKMAFWINMYNAHMMLAVLNNYPVSSPMDLANGKIWDQPLVNMGGKLFSLNQVEHGILRKTFKDPRIHFAVNCAAKSCPPISNKAWHAGNLEPLLEESTKRFINDMTHNSISKKEVKLSKIFEWYKEDFGDVLAYVKKYSDTEIGKNAKLSFNEYNWNLNKK